MRYLVKAAWLAAASCLALPAAAQQSEDELVITATRHPSRAERLPAHVDVIEIEDARERGIASLAEALTGAPGLNVAASGGAGQQTSLFSGGANSNHTLVLFDGVRINDPSSPGSAFDAGQDQLGGLARIEIVQGPMSAVFGSDALGGVINILPRRGGDAPLSAGLDAWAGSFNTTGVSASLDGALGRFRYAVTGEGFATDGYDLVPERMTTRTGHADGAASAAFTGVFDLDLTDTLAVDLLVRHREARADFDAFTFPPPSFNEQRVDDPDLEIARNDLTLARLGAVWRLGGAVSLRGTIGTVEQQREERDSGVVTAMFDGARRFADLTADVRFGETGVLSNAGLVAGLERQIEEVDVDQGFATVVADQDHIGVFVTSQGDIGDVTLTGAVRVDDFDGFGAQTTWRIGASYELSSATRIYAAYGTSFRAPTLYERFISWGNPSLDPEFGEAWEIGGDLRLPVFGQGDGVELGLIYRHLEIEDLIDFSPAFTYANIDQAEIDTAEARFALRPAAWLTARLSYVYTDARDVAADAPLLRRPESVWLASLDFENGPVRAQIAWRSIGERSDQIYGNDGFWLGVGETPGYEVLRASASWTFAPGAQIYLSADNLADANYEPVNAFAGAPRNVMLGVRLKPPN